MNVYEHWKDVPLDDPRVEAVVEALILHSKSLEDSPQTWRAAQIAVFALQPTTQGAVVVDDAAIERAANALAAKLHWLDDPDRARELARAALSAAGGQ